MKKLLPLLVGLALISVSCKKFIEKKQRDLLVEAITSGAWYVEKYEEASVDNTAAYNVYDFLFNENGTVTARSPNGNTAGTWTGNIQTYQITANFPSAGEPLVRLNGTWTIINSTTTYVEAEMGSGASKKILHLRQKP